MGASLPYRGIRGREGTYVESVSAIFAGTVFALFGTVLLGWTVVRVRHREPVALGVGRAVSATVASLLALTALTLGVWCFTRV